MNIKGIMPMLIPPPFIHGFGKNTDIPFDIKSKITASAIMTAHSQRHKIFLFTFLIPFFIIYPTQILFCNTQRQLKIKKIKNSGNLDSSGGMKSEIFLTLNASPLAGIIRIKEFG